MRKSSNPPARIAALERISLAAAAGLALLLAPVPALAQDEDPVETGKVVFWSQTGTDTWTWDTTGTNWTDSDGAKTTFSNSNAVVFGLDANGNPTNESGHITVSGTAIVAPHGDNPGVLIASGSWYFDGGDILGGNFAISGTTTLGFSTGVSGSGQRMFYDQRFEIANKSDFTLRLPDNNVSYFTGSNIVEVDGGVMRSGADSTITFTTDFAGYYFVSNTTSKAGGAIYAGGDLNVVLVTGYTGASVGQGEWNWLNFHFQSNNAEGAGGAIYAAGDITMVAPPSVTGTDAESNIRNHFTPVFQSNTSGAAGGAIFAHGNVAISGSAIFSGNTAGDTGGAIHSDSAVTLGSIATFASNTAASSGGAIYALGDVALSGTMLFANNAAGTIITTEEIKDEITGEVTDTTTTTQGGLGGAIYTAGNLTISGSDTSIIFYGNKVTGSGAPQTSSLAYVGGNFTLADNASLFASGGIVAHEILISSATLKLGEDYGRSMSGLTLTTIDSTGAPAPGTIRFEDATLYANYGTLAVNQGSHIEISGSAFTINAVGVGVSATVGGGTIITADITGTAAIIKTGAGVASLTGTNTYSGETTIEAGTLRGNIADSSTLTINAGATYTSGNYTPVVTDTGTIMVGTDRTIDVLNGDGAINMTNATLTIHSGSYLGSIRNATSVIKQTSGTLIFGSGTAANLDIQEGALNIGGDRTLTITSTATGITTVAPGATLGVNVSDSTALFTDVLNVAPGSIINITGVGHISSYETDTSYTVIVAGTAIDRTYTFLINGKPIDDPITDTSQFLTFQEDTSEDYLSATGTRNHEISVATTLVWSSSDVAHGTFKIDNGTFNLNANLTTNTHTTAWIADWDGNTLTKEGAGTLILSGHNTYTGTTHITDGVLINNGHIQGDINITSTITTTITGTTIIPGTDGDDDEYIYHEEETLIKGFLINNGTTQGNINNAGNYIFQSSSTLIITGTTTDETTGSETYTYSTTYWNGAMNGNLHNTGTATIYLNAPYEWSGTLSGGDTGLIIKTGSSTFTHAGDSTYTGTIQIDQGTYLSGKAHNLDAAGTYKITTTSGTLSLGGHNQNLKNVINNGVLSFGPSATTGVTTFATATIENYTTRINDDGEHEGYGIIEVRSNYNAGLADKLVITGTATGTHAIRITNTDNKTPDKNRQYIPLITGDGVVANNTNIEFIGAIDIGMGRLIVARGDGISALGADPDTWYLASGNQASNVADAILSTASVAGLEWHYQLDTVRQRMGDLRQEALMAPPEKRESPLAYTTVGSKGGNAWFRANAYRLNADARVTTDAFKEDVYGVSLGYDKTYRWEDNQYLLGVFTNIAGVTRDFETRGTGKSNGYGAGFYFSYLKDRGWYGDASLLITTNNNSFTTHPIDRPADTITADYHTLSWGLSIEAGKIIKYKKTGWWIEPSAQTALAVINGRTYKTNTDMEVKMADANIYQFRASLRAGRDISGSPIKPHVRFALVNMSTTGGRIRAGDPGYPQYFTADMDGNRVEAGIGASWVIDEKTQLYLDYEYAKASRYNRPWAINFGFRSTW